MRVLQFRDAPGRRGPLARVAALAGLALLAAAAAVAIPGTAHAAGTASSSMGSYQANTPDRMVDGNLATYYWSDRGVISGDWVKVDLGSSQTVSQIDLLMSKSDSPNDYIHQGVLEISSDNTNWTSLGSFSNQAEVHLTSPGGTTARYVRARATADNPQSCPWCERYWLVVREFAVSATGGGDTTPPAAPTGLTATAVSSSQINLDWADNAEADLASYSVYRSTTSGFTPSASNRIASSVTTSSYNNTGLAASTTYYYKVTAVDTSGNESAPSAQASATTQAGGGPPTQPGQPTSGPAGSNYPHGDWPVYKNPSGSSWYVFQPASPKPTSAPVLIMNHMACTCSTYDTFYWYIQHTVRKGSIVIYTDWEAAGYDARGASLTRAADDVKAAIAWLQADATRVQPQLDKVSYFGGSFGGMVAANMANRHASLGLPVPKSLFLVEPTGGPLGDQFDPDMNGVPAATKVNCMIGETYVNENPTKGCYTVFPKFGHIANANKDFVIMWHDTYGEPDLMATHGATTALPSGEGLDAYDYVFWKIEVAIQTCANAGADCEYALNDTPEHRSTGVWSDGTPIRELRISDTPVTS